MVRSLNKWQLLLLLSSYIILHYIPGAEPLLHFLSQLMHPSCWSLLPIFQEQLQTPCPPRLGPSIWEEVNIYTILGTVILMTVYIWGLEWRKTKSRDKLAGHWRRSDVGRGQRWRETALGLTLLGIVIMSTYASLPPNSEDKDHVPSACHCV